MKERGLIFMGTNVLAIGDDRETMTRRLMKPQPGICHSPDYKGVLHSFPLGGPTLLLEANKCSLTKRRCPHGVPGDRFYVKETLGGEMYASTHWDIWYAADHIQVEAELPDNWYPPRNNIVRHYETSDNIPGGGFAYFTCTVPSLFMPRWAARHVCEITDVRVERVQEISEKDAEAEGAFALDSETMQSAARRGVARGQSEVGPLDYFEVLWDSLHAKPKLVKKNPYTNAPERCYVSYPWEDIRETRERNGLPWYVVGNAWVWKLAFKRIKDDRS